MSLECTIDDYPGAVVMHLYGQITHEEMETYREGLERAMEREPKRLVLDLSELRYISSAGIGALLTLRKKAEAESIDLRLASPLPPVADVLKLARLDTVFRIFPTLEAALGTAA